MAQAIFRSGVGARITSTMPGGQGQRGRDGVDPAAPFRLDHQEFGQPDRGVVHRAGSTVRRLLRPGLGGVAFHAAIITYGPVSYPLSNKGSRVSPDRPCAPAGAPAGSLGCALQYFKEAR